MPEIAARKAGLIKYARELNPKTVKTELKQFLPRSQFTLISQFPKILEQELERL